MTERTPYLILGIGGAHMDRIGHVTGHVFPGGSNPGQMREMVGGGMFNALRVARLRGSQRVALCSVRGGDSAALAVEQSLAASGIEDLSGVFLDRMTASYTAIHDAQGDVITALADMEIYETALPRHVRRKPVTTAIKAAQWLMVDANMPAPAIAPIAEQATGPVVAMGISAAKIGRLAEAGPLIDMLFCNAREAYAFSEADNMPKALAGLRTAMPKAILVVTQGDKDVTLAFQNRDTMKMTPVKTRVMDVTGAGDALAGGTIAALARTPFAPNDHEALQQAVLEGMACAACALGRLGPIASAHDLEAFDTHLDALKAANLRTKP